MIIFEKFIGAVDRESKQTQGRWGQVFFNRLCEARPRLAEAIRGTDLDPYYQGDKGKCGAAIVFVRDGWD